MSETTPHPQVDALRMLQEVFTTEQIKILAEHYKDMKEKGGWGNVDIVFEDGKPVMVRWTVTRKLPKRTEW